MGFRCGIVGLPNVGKSTLFNALTTTQAATAANYPFTTIEPNVGQVAAPDTRLGHLADITGLPRIIHAQLGFIDIAGLVRGASKGEGLGNQFLGHIREVDAIVHLLRCFEDPEVSHVHAVVDPVSDADVVETELMLADLQFLERRHEALAKRFRGGDKEARAELEALEGALEELRRGRPLRDLPAEKRQAPALRALNLLSAKAELLVCNVEEAAAALGNAHSHAVEAYALQRGLPVLTVSAALEGDIASLDDPEERAAFLADAGLPASGLERLIATGYRLLDLTTFFTAGETEVRAWTIPAGASAVEAAGQVHTDMARGFIRAETIDWQELIACGGEVGARDTGKLRLEGRDYVVRDGEVLRFRFSV